MSLPAAAPADVGMDSGRLGLTGRILSGGVRHGVFEAAVLCVVRSGRAVWLSAHGSASDGGTARTDTVFDLASLTKPFTGLSLLKLVEAGWLDLSETVGRHLLGAGRALGRVTLRELATHVSGLPSWKPLYADGLGQVAMVEAILRSPLEAEPGTRYAYSDLGYMLLGAVIEHVTGRRLNECMHRELFGPLAMADTGYLPPPEIRPRIARTGNCPMRPGRVLVGEVHDANAHAFGGVAGHAGLFGTAPDLASVAAMVLGDGSAGGVRMLGLPGLRLARSSQISATLGGHSIGWFTAPNRMLPRGDLLSDHAFGHTGFTGTMIVCDPLLDLAVILLTNRVVNPSDNTAIQAVRRRVINVVAGSVVA